MARHLPVWEVVVGIQLLWVQYRLHRVKSGCPSELQKLSVSVTTHFYVFCAVGGLCLHSKFCKQYISPVVDITHAINLQKCIMNDTY